MSTLEQRKLIYGNAAVEINKRELTKFRVNTNDYFCKYEDELVSLTNKIPNWKTYLTDKQLKIMEFYLIYRNTNAVDIHLKLTNGVTYHTLFGNMKNKKEVGGIFKKLRNAYKVLSQVNDRKMERKKKCQ